LYSIKHEWKGCPTKSVIASIIESKCTEFLIQLTKDKRLTSESWPTLPLEKQSAVFKDLVKVIEYDGLKGKLWIELHGSFTRHEFDLPAAALKKRLLDLPKMAYGHEPHIRKQLLLAYQIKEMLANGKAKNLQQIAEWLNLGKTRLDQIVNLLYLAPKIQEEIITGDPVSLCELTERSLRNVISELDWAKQAAAWKATLPIPYIKPA
jgi:hypothetical protein